MVERAYSFALTDQKIIERVFEDEHAAVNHMVLHRGDALPEHHASNVYMAVIRGTITLRLNDQEPCSYPHGTILAIPFRTLMNVSNQHDEAAEIFVFKAPGPAQMV